VSGPSTPGESRGSFLDGPAAPCPRRSVRGHEGVTATFGAIARPRGPACPPAGASGVSLRNTPVLTGPTPPPAARPTMLPGFQRGTPRAPRRSWWPRRRAPGSSAWSRPGRPVDEPLRPGGTWSRPAMGDGTRGAPGGRRRLARSYVDELGRGVLPRMRPARPTPPGPGGLGVEEPGPGGGDPNGLDAPEASGRRRQSRPSAQARTNCGPRVPSNPAARRRWPGTAGRGPQGRRRRAAPAGSPDRWDSRASAGRDRGVPPGLPAPSGAAARRTRVAPAGPLRVAGSVRQGVDHALVVTAGSLEDLASPSWIARHFAAAPFLPATWVGGDRRRRLPPTYPRCPWPRPSITRSRFAGPGLPADDPDLGPVRSPTAEESATRTISIQEWPGFRALPADRNSLEGGRGRADRVVGRRIHQDVRVGHAGHPRDGSHAGGNRSNVGGGPRRRGSAGPDLPVIRVREGLGA